MKKFRKGGSKNEIYHSYKASGKIKKAKPFWQEFEIEAEGELSIAAMLNELNARQKLTDKSGKEAEPISWECGCMVKKCGACAMRINGLPELACSTFLQSLKGK